MKITKQDFEDYVSGWLTVMDYPNRLNDLSIGNMKAALHNALNMIEDDQDGIEAGLKRKEYYKTLPHLQEG